MIQNIISIAKNSRMDLKFHFVVVFCVCVFASLNLQSASDYLIDDDEATVLPPLRQGHRAQHFVSGH
jgi:hypothetical protein